MSDAYEKEISSLAQMLSETEQKKREVLMSALSNNKPTIVLNASLYDELECKGLLNHDAYIYIRQEKIP